MIAKPKTQKPATEIIKPTERASKAARQSTAASKRPSPKAAPALPQPAIGSKQSQLIACLQSGAGASIAQMMTLTGWQAHTVRGAISGVLRKKLGFHVTCDARSGDGERLYRIEGTVV